MSVIDALPPKIKAYAELMRIDRPVGTLLLLWPTWIALWLAAKGFPGWKLFLVFTLGTFLMRSAGCVINDYADRDIDGKVWRTCHRPLAEGRVTPKEALYLAGFLALCSSSLLVFLPYISWAVAIVAVLCSALYPWTKRFLPIPQAFLGVTFSLGILMAWSAVTGTLPLSAWLLWLANVAWVLAYDTAYAMADRPDDVGLGIHSSALWFGQYDVHVVHGLTILFLAMISYIEYLNGMYGWHIRSCWLCAVLFCAFLWLFRLNRQLNDREPAVCLSVFRQHHWAGALLWLGIALAYAH